MECGSVTVRACVYVCVCACLTGRCTEKETREPMASVKMNCVLLFVFLFGYLLKALRMAVLGCG